MSSKQKQSTSQAEDDKRYKITPKGIFLLALQDIGLIEDLDDRRASVAYELFDKRMEECGFIKKEDGAE